MTTTSRHSTHDRLLARVRLTEGRLTRIQGELGDGGPADELTGRVNLLLVRCDDLAEQIQGWDEVEVGTLNAVEDLGAAVDTVEADLTAALATEPANYAEALDRQVRVWRARVDRLRLQGGLASMDAHDELESVAKRLESVRDTVLDDLREVAEDARRTVADLRSDVGRMLADMRETVEHAAATIGREEK